MNTGKSTSVTNVRHTMLYLGTDENEKTTSIGVTVMAPVSQWIKPTTVQIHAQTGKQVVKHKFLFCPRENQRLDIKKDIRYTANYGQARLFFDSDELGKLVQCTQAESDEPGIHLLGFLPAKDLFWDYQLRINYHMVPNESLMIGSKTAFKLLLNSLARTNMLAVGRYVHHTNAAPRLVALYPRRSSEAFAEGLSFVFLPYNDELSEPPMESCSEVSLDYVSAFTGIVQALTQKDKNGFDPAQYANPQYVEFQQKVKQQLDGTPAATEIDLLFPDYDSIEKKAGPLLSKLSSALDSVPSAVKMVKLERAVKPISVADFEEISKRHAQGSLSQLSVPKLTNFVRVFGYASMKRKAELIDQANLIFKKYITEDAPSESNSPINSSKGDFKPV